MWQDTFSATEGVPPGLFRHGSGSGNKSGGIDDHLYGKMNSGYCVQFRVFKAEKERFVRFRLSRHAEEEMKRRQIPLAMLDDILQQPEQIIPQGGGKLVYQSKVDFGSGRMFLLRAVVDDANDPATVITVYRTSKIDKYWRR